MTATTELDIDAVAGELRELRSAGAFDLTELEGLPDPVRAYFEASIAPGAAVARATRLRMGGQIRIGRWLPFTAREVLAPHRGFVWQARAARLVSGSDAYCDGRGAMRWKACGVVTVMHADGGDIATSAAGRCGGEAIWLPSALLPRFCVDWSAVSDNHIVATFKVDTTPIELHLRIDDQGLVTSVGFERWGDPDRSGTFGWHHFGGDITAHRTFDGLTVPSEGSWGWHHGTDRWAGGEFFRCRITDYNAL
jgi:hypothetical protein